MLVRRTAIAASVIVVAMIAGGDSISNLSNLSSGRKIFVGQGLDNSFENSEIQGGVDFRRATSPLPHLYSPRQLLSLIDPLNFVFIRDPSFPVVSGKIHGNIDILFSSPSPNVVLAGHGVLNQAIVKASFPVFTLTFESCSADCPVDILSLNGNLLTPFIEVTGASGLSEEQHHESLSEMISADFGIFHQVAVNSAAESLVSRFNTDEQKLRGLRTDVSEASRFELSLISSQYDLQQLQIANEEAAVNPEIADQIAAKAAALLVSSKQKAEQQEREQQKSQAQELARQELGRIALERQEEQRQLALQKAALIKEKAEQASAKAAAAKAAAALAKDADRQSSDTQFSKSSTVISVNSIASSSVRSLGGLLERSAPFVQSIRLSPSLVDRRLLAERLAQRGEFGLAIDNYSIALVTSPGDSSLYLKRAQAKDQAGDRENALLDYNRAIQLNPNDIGAYVARGSNLALSGDRQAALLDYNRAVEISPLNEPARLRRAELFGELGDHQRAIVDYSLVLQANPANVIALYARANLREDSGYRDDAIGDYDKILSLKPDHPAALYKRGRLRDEIGDKAGALEDYTRSLQINRGQANVYNNRGIVRAALGDLQGALQDYSSAIEAQPGFVAAYNNRAAALALKGDHRGAIFDYTKAILINPNYIAAYSNRGMAHEAVGDIGAACTDWRKAGSLGDIQAQSWVAAQCSRR